MKRAISISIGSKKRDKIVQINLLGEEVSLERRGTDGDLAKAAQLYVQLDGQVDAFGVGGTDLGFLIDEHFYPLHSTAFIVDGVHHTPVVDGNGLKATLENRAPQVVEQHFGLDLGKQRVFVLTAVDRWGLSHGFVQAGCECRFGDMLFSLGLPFVLHTEKQVKTMAALLLPVVSRLPFHWIYPVGESQEERKPKYVEQFEWADIIAGDCHYLKRYMPERLPGKILVTNTTTEQDRAFFKAAGVRGLVTTTPLLDGRTFGTNVIEAALLAASGYQKPVNYAQADDYLVHLNQLVEEAGLIPQVQEL